MCRECLILQGYARLWSYRAWSSCVCVILCVWVCCGIERKSGGQKSCLPYFGLHSALFLCLGSQPREWSARYQLRRKVGQAALKQSGQAQCHGTGWDASTGCLGKQTLIMRPLPSFKTGGFSQGSSWLLEKDYSQKEWGGVREVQAGQPVLSPWKDHRANHSYNTFL